MALHFFDRRTLTRQPWHNGGGTTREIVCQPAGASMQDFDWRISIADVDRDGPFSVLPGVERSMVLLEGPGLRLRSRCGRLDHRLDTPGQPLQFDGGLALDAELLGGPSEDFNVMTRAGRCRAQVTHQGPGRFAPTAHGGPGLLLVLQGAWSLVPVSGPARELAAGQGLWWADTPGAFTLHSNSAGARLLQVQIVGATPAQDSPTTEAAA